MKNEFYYRFFLICNKLANDVLGFKFQNFAKLILEENNGRYGNTQMTKYFIQAEEFLSRLIGNDEGFMWDELEMEEIAKLTPEQLQEDFDNYCEGKMKIDLNPNI
jgi:hypothetical protein